MLNGYRTETEIEMGIVPTTIADVIEEHRMLDPDVAVDLLAVRSLTALQAMADLDAEAARVAILD